MNPSEPSCVVRGMLGPAGEVRMVTRNLSLAAEGQLSMAPAASHPSAFDLLVSALVADLLAGLGREATRDGVAIDDAELNVAARIDNPLAALGVVGETGSAALSSIRGSLYLTCDQHADTIDALWRRVLERAPVYSTLRRSVEIAIVIQPVP